MKKLRILLLGITVLLIAACNSSNDTPQPKAASLNPSVVTGVAAIGIVSEGTVTAYDFTDCTKGDKLAESQLMGTNDYELTFSSRLGNHPILLELSNFIYKEESSLIEINATTDILYSSFVLQDGTNQNASISFWTHLAYARTTFLCGQSPTPTPTLATVSQNIIDSNKTFSDLLFFDIIKVMPQQIDNSKQYIISDDSQLNPIRYGVANAAISYLTYGLDISSGGLGRHNAFNSMVFAETAFDDFSADNILDGIGRIGELTLGALSISETTYRTTIPDNIHYTLAASKISPNTKTADISVMAISLNENAPLGIFPDTPVIATSDIIAVPAIIGSSFCPAEQCSDPQNPELGTYIGCNVCWEPRGPDREVPCQMTIEFDIKDAKNVPYTVSGDFVTGGTNDKVTPIFSTIDPGGSRSARFHLVYGFNQPIRALGFQVTNQFGLTQNFSVEVDARLPAPQGTIFNSYSLTCKVSITSVGN